MSSARNKLFTEFDEGVALINYYGHGGPTRLANEGLLLSSDVDSLKTNIAAPVVTAMTCLVGEFFFPTRVKNRRIPDTT